MTSLSTRAEQAKPEEASYPSWICADCGRKYGSRVPTFATYHYGECGWCGLESGPVTEPRDYGYPMAPAAISKAIGQ